MEVSCAESETEQTEKECVEQHNCPHYCEGMCVTYSTSIIMCLLALDHHLLVVFSCVCEALFSNLFYVQSHLK